MLEQQDQFKHLPIEHLQPGRYQPRCDMANDSLQELAQSMVQQGMIQPILVRELGLNCYEIIAGERRWRAAQLAEFETVPCLIRQAEDQDVAVLALIENLQRENLNPIEEALALQRLHTAFHLTQQEIGAVVGKARSTITNLLRLLKLHQDVQAMLAVGQLEMGHARALLSLEPFDQIQLAQQIVAKDWSVRQAEAKVKQMQSTSHSLSNNQDRHLLRLEARLQSLMGTRVKLKHLTTGQGKLEIHYINLDQLDQILKPWYR